MNNHSGAIKIRHTASATERLKQAHTLMGISKSLGGEFEGLFNQWAKIRITDAEVKKLIQIAIAPNKEVLENLAGDKLDLLSTYYTNIIDYVYGFDIAYQPTCLLFGNISVLGRPRLNIAQLP